MNSSTNSIQGEDALGSNVKVGCYCGWRGKRAIESDEHRWDGCPKCDGQVYTLKHIVADNKKMKRLQYEQEIVTGKKTCADCNQEKSLDEYYTQNHTTKERGEFIYYIPYCIDCTKRKAAKWQKDNPEKTLLQKRASNIVQKERLRENGRRRRLNGEHKKWQQKNRDKIRKYNEYRGHKNHDITEIEWDKCKRYFEVSCAYCGIHEEIAKQTYGQVLHKEHVDHDGANDLSNCVPACKYCNSKKWKFHIDEWYNNSNPNFTEERYNRIHTWLNNDYSRV